MSDDLVQLHEQTDLLGENLALKSSIDRSMYAAGLHAALHNVSLEKFVSFLTNEVEATTDYVALCSGERQVGQRISLLFNPHRLSTTSKSGPVSLYDSLKDPKFADGLARAMMFKKDKVKDLLYQAVFMGINAVYYVSEFPPHVARDLALEHGLTKSSWILDPCAGWGGRMLGFSTVVNSYTCCEPSARTAAGLRKLFEFIKNFRPDFEAIVFEAPFEDVAPSLQRGCYDFAMTSPPYYDTEHYAPGEVTNSFNRYASFDAWCQGFYEPLIIQTMTALKPDAAFVLNIGSRTYPLNERMRDICKGRYSIGRLSDRLSGAGGLGKETSGAEGETFYVLRHDAVPHVFMPVPLVPEPPAAPETPFIPDVVTPEPMLEVVTSAPPALPEPMLEPAVLPLADVTFHQESVVTGTLLEFLGRAPKPVDYDWKATEPLPLDGIDEIELDTETNGLRWFAGDRPIGISYRRPDGFAQYLPWGHLPGGNLSEDTVKRWAQRELRGKRITGLNTGFDVHMLREWGVDLEEQGCTVSNVQHYAALLDDNRRQFKMDVLAKDFLQKEKTGKDLDAEQMAQYHAAEVAPRALDDVQITAELREAMWPLLDEQDLQRVRALEDSVIFPVCEMERNAAPINVPLLKQWREETRRIQEEALFEVRHEVGFDVNPDANSDWVRLFEHFKIPITERTEKGAASFTDAILKNIDNLFVQLVRKAGKLASLRSKFLDAYDAVIGSDQLLRYSLHQLRTEDYGTVRGRFSASNKNIQQVMNRDTHMTSFGDLEFFIRKLFVPKSGLFFSADAAQIEFRLFAHYSDSERLLQAYVDDPTVSFHRVVEGILKPFRSDLPYTKIKSMNFLFVYGGGNAHAADYLELPQEIADQFCRVYHSAFPEVKKLGKKAENIAKNRGYVKSILGRRARFPDPKFAYKALNAVIQPTAADIFKQKVVEVHAERKRTGFVMRMPVHDELCGDTPDQESAQMVAEILNRQSFPLKAPILWSVNTGQNWAECK